MEWIAALQANAAAASGAAALLGLMVGSFLNVVIHRLPLMLEQEWKRQCAELAGAVEAERETERVNLVTPRSRCPRCGHTISALENIPILSYLFLGGRCSQCGSRIPLRYPLVELASALLAAAVVWHFGFTWEAGAALLLTWALIALAVIDLERQLLPDVLTLPFLWLGLLWNLGDGFTDLRSAVVGAAAGYLCLWIVYHLFRLLTGKEGMGYGDFKLLGLLGAWLGWQSIPLIVLLSSLVGAAVGVALIVFRRHKRHVPIPFGPYLAAAGWIALLWGERITGAYLRWSGIGG